MKQYLTPKWLGGITAGVLVVIWLIGFIWSFEPDVMDVRQLAQSHAEQNNQKVVTGFVTTTALIEVSNMLMDKSGGYISNDVLPPGVMLDNMSSWEFGVLEMVRDLSLIMRTDFSRSQSQSQENPELVKSQPLFNNDHLGWILPSAESKYSEGIEALEMYRDKLASQTAGDAQFYARADNLYNWLKLVEKRLGSVSQKLSASVGVERINTDLAGDVAATQATPTSSKLSQKTSWWKLDDNFYQARGTTWALIHFLKAVEVDFADVLEKKNALISLRQIIRELEATQQTIWSPMILNGSGFGMLANHSLVMANYISRANAAIIELSELLNKG